MAWEFATDPWGKNGGGYKQNRSMGFPSLGYIHPDMVHNYVNGQHIESQENREPSPNLMQGQRINTAPSHQIAPNTGYPQPNYQPPAPAPQAPVNPLITTGITAGPVWSPGQVAGAQSGFRNTLSNALNLEGAMITPEQKAALQSTNQQVSGPLAKAASTEFGRVAAVENAKQTLNSQKARSRAGLGWAQVGLGQMNNRSEFANSILRQLGIA